MIKIYPPYYKNEGVRAEGVYMIMNDEDENEIIRKLETGEYALQYIGTYSFDDGVWTKTWYTPISLYTKDIPKWLCEKYKGIKLEGLCFVLNSNIAIYRKEILVKRDNRQLAYLFYDYFEVVPAKS